MRIISILCLWCCSTVLAAQQPVQVIFDTDIGPDYDDIGAMALLHAFENQGRAKILATISCNALETTAPTLSVLNTYFNRPEIPIGIVKAKTPYEACRQKWAEAIIAKYPHALKSNDDAVNAVAMYRRVLSVMPDQSVTIISVGFFTNLANLLESPPDVYSSSTGRDLVTRKVKQLVSMAAGIGKDGMSAHEFNVRVDARATRKVFTEWPTPILLSGFEIGEKILTGIKLIQNESIQGSPVKDAYKVALEADKNTKGRNSWDQTAVLAGVLGAAPYFNVRMLNFEIKDDGTNVLIPGEKFQYLTEKMPPSDVAQVIETLMMQQPLKK